MIVFIDAGFHQGEHLGWFWKKYGSNGKTKYYAFEANPELEASKFFEKSNIGNVVFIGKAVSTENGKRMFNIHENTMSSTFYPKDYGKVVKQIEVDTIDFSQWVQENISPKDFNILKLDIEGEEYPVLERMILDGTIQLIDELYCEFHEKKVRGLNGADREDLIRRIEEKGCKVKGNQ